MNIHEYQAHKMLASYGIPVPYGEVAETPEQAKETAKKIGGKVVVKAQIHAGGRGKAGGVTMVESSGEVTEVAKNMLGQNLVTVQTGSSGVPVNKVLIVEATEISKELYVSITIDGELGVPVVIASTEGGVEIEDVAIKSPEKIIRIAGDPLIGLSPYKARELSSKLEVPKSKERELAQLLLNLYRLFSDNDCELIEINPLVITTANEFVALDAKISLEEDAFFRHKEFENLRDPDQLDYLERRASDHNLAYVKLDGGRVGCMVNGAGLAMATMDITKWAGANPANFLDIGGSADEGRIQEAFKIIVSDPDVEIILVNLFAGIARSDVIATGIVNAANETGAKLPMVVAMRGTNAEQGRKILSESGLPITPAEDMSTAANILKEMLNNQEGEG